MKKYLLCLCEEPIRLRSGQAPRRGNLLLVVLCLVLLAAGIASASDGVIGKAVSEHVMVVDSYGRPRTDCKLALFTVDRMYRDGARTTPSATTFRNVTSAGSYSATFTPAVAGEYKCMLNYSGVSVGTFTRTVRAYDMDTAYSGLSGQLLTIPTNPLLANDPRVPATVMATSVEVAKAASLTAHDAEVKAAIAVAYARIDGIDDDPWDNPSRTITGGSVDEAVTVTSPVGLTAEATAGIDAELTGSHGTGLWSAAGTVTVVPFQGTVSYETATRSADVHVVRGDSVAVPYNAGVDLTGWQVWFGAKANPADDTYAMPPRDITAYVTGPEAGGGLINLTPSDTGIQPRRYFAEVELRGQGETRTPLKFFLWIDADVIR